MDTTDNTNDKPVDATQNIENTNVEANHTKEENLNEVFDTKPFENLEVIKDIAREPIHISMKAKYVALVEGKNYEISVKGLKVYDSKSKGNIAFEESGVMLERTMIPYSGLTLRLK